MNFNWLPASFTIQLEFSCQFTNFKENQWTVRVEIAGVLSCIQKNGSRLKKKSIGKVTCFVQRASSKRPRATSISAALASSQAWRWMLRMASPVWPTSRSSAWRVKLDRPGAGGDFTATGFETVRTTFDAMLRCRDSWICFHRASTFSVPALAATMMSCSGYGRYLSVRLLRQWIMVSFFNFSLY